MPGAPNPVVEKDDAGLHFSWTSVSNEKWASSSDQVMLLAFDLSAFEKNKENKTANTKKEAYYMLSGARRKAGMETLEIPSHVKGDLLHTYIAFISDDRELVSMSTYLGEVIF